MKQMEIKTMQLEIENAKLRSNKKAALQAEMAEEGDRLKK